MVEQECFPSSWKDEILEIFVHRPACYTGATLQSWRKRAAIMERCKAKGGNFA
jgi:hypothetical protein